MSPIDAVRNGQTGERFRKKSMMSLGRSRLPETVFLALNDIVSSPKRFSIITFAFFLCLSLLLVLSTTVSTAKSGALFNLFDLADFDISAKGEVTEFMTENGHEKAGRIPFGYGGKSRPKRYARALYAGNDVQATCVTR